MGGDTSKLIADSIAAKALEEESDSTTPSPKPEDRSSSPVRATINPLSTLIDQRSIESMYSPLRNSQTATTWAGGWSNRARAGFSLNANTMETESPAAETQNITPEEEEVELTNDEEIEVVGMDSVESVLDDVHLVQLDPLDGDKTA